MPAYHPQRIEPKWQLEWERNKTFRAIDLDPSRPKLYILDMFPYPSGAGLHVGHPGGIYRHRHLLPLQADARIQRPAPDGLGRLRSARRAIRRPDQHPSPDHHPDQHRYVSPPDQVARFLVRLGSRDRYDRPRLLQVDAVDLPQDPRHLVRPRRSNGPTGRAACGKGKGRPIAELPIPPGTRDPDAYRDSRRLAYRALVPVNWCPELGTVLANEEVIDGKSERGGFPVVRMPLTQWMLRITAYAERLIDELEDVDWPRPIKDMQRNWVGRSEGAEVDFSSIVAPAMSAGRADRRSASSRPAPTRLFGATYMVLAPEHPLVDRAHQTAQQSRRRGLSQGRGQQERDRPHRAWPRPRPGSSPAATRSIPSTASRFRSGSPTTCSWAMAPARSWPCPVTTSATSSLPGHSTCRSSGVVADERGAGGCPLDEAEPEPAIAVNSRNSRDRARRPADRRGEGRDHRLARKTRARQEDGQLQAARLAVLAPAILGRAVSGRARRERPTARASPSRSCPSVCRSSKTSSRPASPSPRLSKARNGCATPKTTGARPTRCRSGPARAGITCAISIPRTTTAPWDPEKEKYWMPVDLYVGGAEHAVLHLLYSRFWHKVLFDRGLVSTPEPFQKAGQPGDDPGRDRVHRLSRRDRDTGSAPEESDRPGVVASQACRKPGHQERRGLRPGAEDPSVRVDARAHKMSKARGNVINPDAIVAEYGADSLRLYEMFMGPLEAVKPWSMKGVEGVYRFLAQGLADDRRRRGRRWSGWTDASCSESS